jgi:hypothetical protein
MNSHIRRLAIVGVFAIAFVAQASSPAHAQGYFNLSVPGFSMSLGGGGFYSSYYPGYSVVAPNPVVVAPSYPVYAPYYAPRAYIAPGAYYGVGGPYYYGTGWYRPYRHGFWW